MLILRNHPALGLVIFCLLGPVISGNAQWTTQTIELKPGWNAVFLEIQPEPRECDAVLSGLPIESVWRWNRSFNAVEFIQDPSELMPQQPDWLVHFPVSHPLADKVSLFTLDGGRPYLIRLPDGVEPVNWTIHGKVVLRDVEWISDSLNFVGFSLPASPPTFQQFFGGSAAHVGQEIYRLNSQGYWQSTPSNTVMKNGEAFWVRCSGISRYQGPIEVITEQKNGVIYGRILVEQGLTIRNSSTTSKTVQITRVDSNPAPLGAAQALGGQVPINYWQFDVQNNQAGWNPLPATLIKSLAAGESWQVKLEVKRSQMTEPPEKIESVYQSILQITDTDNSGKKLVPVTSEGMQQYSTNSVDRRAGLWVGNAEITHVNQPASIHPQAPLAVASPFQFRILVHVDESGKVRMLQKVLQMWNSGTYRLNEAGIKETEEPGRFVLVTDNSLIPRFSGAALRDGESVARRFSSAVFGFRSPILMDGVGEFGGDSNIYSCNVVLEYNDPLNPFTHKYHPDHDNFDNRFEKQSLEGHESFAVTRSIQLQFLDTDHDNLSLAGWGDSQVGGTYKEAISGLHKSQLQLLGKFRLQHANRVGTLNE